MVSLVVLSLLATGCKGSKDVDSPVTPIQQHNSASLKQEDALRVLTQELSKKLEYTLYFLQEVKLGDSTIYAFQRSKDNGETTTIDFVHSKTGRVYYDSLELLLDEFNNTEDKEPYISESYINRNIYFIEMKSLKNDEEVSWSTYIANDNPYPSLEEAKQAIIKVYGENHPTLSLLGKDIAEVEKITKQPPKTEIIEEGEYGNSYEVKRITLEDMEISFNYKNVATDILLQGSQEILGVKIGDTFDEIIEVLGLPDRLGQDEELEQEDPESDGKVENGYTMHYNFGEFSIEFYAESKESPTISALLLLKKH